MTIVQHEQLNIFLCKELALPYIKVGRRIINRGTKHTWKKLTFVSKNIIGTNTLVICICTSLWALLVESRKPTCFRSVFKLL